MCTGGVGGSGGAGDVSGVNCMAGVLFKLRELSVDGVVDRLLLLLGGVLGIQRPSGPRCIVFQKFVLASLKTVGILFYNEVLRF